DICRLFGEPQTPHEIFTDTILLDQCTKVVNVTRNVVTTSFSATIIANCNSQECITRALDVSRSNVSSSKTQHTCYTYPSLKGHSENISSEMPTCTGEYCYASEYRDITTRGCISVLDDSLTGRKVENGVFDYVLIHFYLCSQDFCNQQGVNKTTQLKV
ncbi:hypothetical protein PMAYCL1PPCAC_21382, partial [Pristionchus mayeri]